MRLLVQADDFGMTRGVARGIVFGAERGIIRNTGLFANMPWADECVEWIRPHLGSIAFGIDLNLTTGSPLCSAAEVPSLVDDSGNFLSSGKSRSLDTEENGYEHATEAEVRREFEAQLARFERIVGKKPDYIHAHAYTTPRITDIQRAIAQREGIPYSGDVWQRLAGFDIAGYRIPWYVKPATLENQAASSLEDYILAHGEELLAQDNVVLCGHMGYVDADLLRLSSYSLLRAKDLEGVVSTRVLKWVQSNDVDLIDYRQL